MSKSKNVFINYFLAEYIPLFSECNRAYIKKIILCLTVFILICDIYFYMNPI